MNEQRTTKTTELPGNGVVKVSMIHTERPNRLANGARMICGNRFELSLGSGQVLVLNVAQARELRRMLGSFKALQ